MRHPHVVPLVALLAACGPAEIGGGLHEDPADGFVDPVAEYVNPSASRSTATAMSPCGTVLATFEGTQAFSNGFNTGTGYSCGGTGAYGYQYQCVELVMRHFNTHWGLRWHGNAKDLLWNAPKDRVDVFLNNGSAPHPPVPGDMIVWPNGTYGHVALVTAVGPTSVKIIEQNVKGDGRATLPLTGNKVGARWGSWVPSGWAHARANTGGTTQPQPAPAPPPAPPPAPSCHLGAVYGSDYCSEACPCDAGQGDCDSDAQCRSGLVCAADVGTDYGAPWYVDVCQKPAQAAPPPPPSPAGPLSATCPGCDLSTHDCTGYKGTFSCVPRSAGCNHTDGYLFRQCNCTGWQFCLPSGQWSSSCAPAQGLFACQ